MPATMLCRGTRPHLAALIRTMRTGRTPLITLRPMHRGRTDVMPACRNWRPTLLRDRPRHTNLPSGHGHLRKTPAMKI